ncbi:PAS domain-containing protein [Agrobacterium rosae]|uniref:PAS domain-containing protein n=1 Tax=Agrobacterium rosae TaxID=1972867 RepID=A0AAW9FHL7_9HYPH|nr:PAS domain-containing protein [Agrobacterium rosae]MDX8305360.1 PAS domain-containing protein [Agrobacterium rosae]MDX8312148.1 PAS domain-containing protein [Agrobacterium rosae]POO56046.1 histidine kinase [Agrobacterium rosae]
MPQLEIDQSLQDFFQKSSVALALSYAQDDQHLALVNDKFCALTGYSSDDVVGKNCRMLQTSPNGTHAENATAREEIHEFLQVDGPMTIRTPIVNFRKDNSPFVNLLFMSKLKATSGQVRYILASQFDVSRAHAHLLQDYELELDLTLTTIKPLLDDHNIMIEGTLTTIANSTTTIAQAKLTLAEWEQNSPY